MINRLLALFGARPSALGVARELGKKLGAAPTEQAGAQRVTGTWKGMRCQVLLDEKADQMAVTARAGPQDTTWELRFVAQETEGLTFVSTQAALTPPDAQRLEKLPMKVRLHLIEVVEAGQGSVRLADGLYTLKVRRAGLTRANAAAQAAIRLDVLADLVRAAAKGF